MDTSYAWSAFTVPFNWIYIFVKSYEYTWWQYCVFSAIHVWFVGSLTSLCHSNGHIETMPAREINPFTALTRIRYQFLRTQWSTSNHQRVDMTTPHTAQPSGMAAIHNVVICPNIPGPWYSCNHFASATLITLLKVDDPPTGSTRCYSQASININVSPLFLCRGALIYACILIYQYQMYLWNSPSKCSGLLTVVTYIPSY